VLPELTEELARPSQKGFWLDQDKRLFPGPDHPRQEDKEKPIRLFVDWSRDLSMQDNELLTQQRVFRQQFGFAAGQIGERSKQKGAPRWFDPPQNAFLERLQAQTDSLLDEGKYGEHKMEPLLQENRFLVSADPQQEPH